MKKLLFFDIDGTLAYPGQSPSAATMEAIRTARRNGHKAFLSTGRTVDSIPPSVAEIGFDGGIFSSGGIVMLGETILAERFMPASYVTEIIHLLLSKSIFFTLETPDGRINSDNGEFVLSQIDMNCISDEMQRFTRDVIFDPTALPYSAYCGQLVYKIAYYSTNPSISEQLSAELGHSVTIVPFHNIPGFPLTMGEISDPSITKGQALNTLCHHFSMSTAQCIAFGDSMNDAEIVHVAGLGIAMGNAVPALKAVADMICDNCENDGIAKALHELKLI